MCEQAVARRPLAAHPRAATTEVSELAHSNGSLQHAAAPQEAAVVDFGELADIIRCGLSSQSVQRGAGDLLTPTQPQQERANTSSTTSSTTSSLT